MRWMVYIALSSLLLGCRTINPSVARPESKGLASPETTSLGRLYADAQARHPGQSGFRLLEYGPEALMARAAMVDRAERTLDLQYYIYDPGKVGHALTQRLLEAADRGVRVRLLLDDNNQDNDRPLIVLASHPNIEVRVFNPFRYRARWMRIPQYLTDLNRINRRMHNKIIVADNQLAILGGRNIGDIYFDIGEEGNLSDFDVLIAGPLVRQASVAFDEFWNSPWALPAPGAFVPTGRSGRTGRIAPQSPGLGLRSAGQPREVRCAARRVHPRSARRSRSPGVGQGRSDLGFAGQNDQNFVGNHPRRAAHRTGIRCMPAGVADRLGLFHPGAGRIETAGGAHATTACRSRC